MAVGMSVTVTCFCGASGTHSEIDVRSLTDSERNAGAGPRSEAVTRDRDVVDAYRDRGRIIGPGGVRDEVAFAAGLPVTDCDLDAGDYCSSSI